MPWRMTDGESDQYNRALRDLVELVDHPDMAHDIGDLAAILSSVTALVIALAGLVRAIRSTNVNPAPEDP